MADQKNKPPDFFEETQPFDPVTAAMGRESPAGPAGKAPPAAEEPKKKVGFYLPVALVDRFDRTFYELKLAGRPVENKSALLEAALELALEDLDRADDSRLLQKLGG